jgi:hypothetical protein
LRIATKALYPSKEISVSVQNDGANGIFWTTIS